MPGRLWGLFILGSALAGCGVTTIPPPSGTGIAPSTSAGGSAFASASVPPSAPPTGGPTSSTTAVPGNVLQVPQIGLQMVVPGDVGELSYTIAPATGIDGLRYQLAFATSTLSSAWSSDSSCTQATAELLQVSVYSENPVDLAGQPEFVLLGQVGGNWFAVTQTDFADGCTAPTEAIAAHQILEVEQAIRQAIGS